MLKCSLITVRRLEATGSLGKGVLEPFALDHAPRWTFDRGVVEKFAETFTLDEGRSKRRKAAKKRHWDGAASPKMRQLVMTAIRQGKNMGEIIRVSGASEGYVLRCYKIESMTPAQALAAHEHEVLQNKLERQAKEATRQANKRTTLAAIAHANAMRSLSKTD